MYFINPHIPAYYFNRKKQTEPVDGKFTYCYPNGDKIEKYKVSPKVYKALKKRDKKEYYSDRRQFRHRTNFPKYYNDYEDKKTMPNTIRGGTIRTKNLIPAKTKFAKG